MRPTARSKLRIALGIEHQLLCGDNIAIPNQKSAVGSVKVAALDSSVSRREVLTRTNQTEFAHHREVDQAARCIDLYTIRSPPKISD
jgi:hypothetical protein